MKTLHTIYTNFAKRFAVVLTLLTFGLTSAWAVTETATLTFDDIAKRTAYNKESNQIWEENDIIFTHNKASSSDTINVACKPIRCYKNSQIIIEHTSGNIKEIQFDCNSSSYATALKNSIGNAATVSSDKVTVTFAESDAAFTVELTSGQVRLDAITVTYEATPSTFTVTCKVNEETPWGTLSSTDPISDLASGTSISAEGNVLTIGETEITATPNAQDANYTYAFSEWTGIPAGGKVTADVTVTANFTSTARTLTNYRTTCSNKPSVSFALNGGSGSFNPEPLDGDSYTIPETEPTRNGYNFAGWKIQDGDETIYKYGTTNSTIQNITESITLVAQWSAIEYTITYYLNGGSGVENSTYTIEYEDITLPTPTPEQQGLTFVGWYENAEFTGLAVTKISRGSIGDKEFWAKWEKATPTFTWSAATCTAALEAENTFPELNNPNSLTPVTYTSSNTDVATIDANGNITLVATGTTIITATGAETATHKSAAAPYELTVVASNCKWVETDIANINSGDEVIVTMTNGTITWALSDHNGTSDAPDAIKMLVDGVEIYSPYFAPEVDMNEVEINNIIWNIDKGDDNKFIFHPIGKPTYNLYCNTAENNNNRVRVGNSNNAILYHKFVIEDNLLKNAETSHYLGIYQEQDWRGYAKSSQFAGQTLKFYKRECLDASKVWVEGNLTNVTCDTQLPQQLAKDGSITLTFTAADGYVLPNTVTVTNATKTWNKEDGTLTISNPTNNVTVTVEAVELHTITWMVGGSELTTGSQTTSVENGKQITAIPDAPDDNTLADCGATKFMGWSESNLGSAEGQAAPTDLFTTVAEAQSKIGGITENKTFYAVFATAEGSSAPTQYTAGDEGSFVLAAKNGNKWYALPTNPTVTDGKITGSEITVTTTDGVDHVTTANASGYIWTIANATNGQTISDGSKYIYHSNGGASGTKLDYGTSVSYKWTITKENDGLSFKAIGGNKDDNRGMLVNKTTFGGYSLSNEGEKDYYRISVLPISDGVSYSNYVTQCCTPWEAPTLSATTSIAVDGNTTITPNSGTTYGNVTYSSSDEKIATVDARSGIVTGVKPGKATITATWDGVDDDPATNYCKATTTIDITVTGSFTITYDANDALATGTTESTVIEYPDGKGTVATNDFALNGHEFVKWNTEEDGNGISYNAGDAITLTDDITLYAIWQPNQYDITVNVVGGSITLGTTTITTANTPQIITDVVAHGQSFSFTNPAPNAEYETPYTITLVSGTATVTNNSLTINNVQSDLEITIEYTLKPVYTITYNIPDDGGELAADAVTSMYKGGSITLPNVSNPPLFDCETFIGWTTYGNRAYENTEGQMPSTFYEPGSSLTISDDIQLYAVYSRAGNGPSGSVELTCNDMARWKEDVLGGDNNSYGTIITRTATDGSVWTTNGQIQNAGGVDLTGAYYIKLPDLPGNISTIEMKVSERNLSSGENACSENVAYATSRTFYFRSEANGSNLFSSNPVADPSRSRTIEITEGNYTTGYIINGEGTSHIHAVSVTYGSPNIISTKLKCTNEHDEFSITYDINQSYLPVGAVVPNNKCTGGIFKFSELTNGQYTICNSITPPALWQLVGWNALANGSSPISYRPGQVITQVPYTPITLYAQWAPEVLTSDGGVEEILCPTTNGGSVTLPLGSQLCQDDLDKYDFIGWTEDDPLLWKQGVEAPTILEKNNDGTTTLTPATPTTVYAVYGQKTTINSRAFYLTYTHNDQTYYAKLHNSYVFTGTTNQEEAIPLYLEQYSKEYSNRYYLYYISEGQRVYVSWTDDRLYLPSELSEDHGWIVTGNGSGGYSFQSVNAIKYGKEKYIHINDANINVAASADYFQKTTAPEYQYFEETTCTDQIRITFVTGGAILKDATDQLMEYHYIDATTNDVIQLPYCEYDGWEFKGWVGRYIAPTEVIENEEDILKAKTDYTVGASNVTLYAYYEQQPPIVDFDGTNSGEWKIYSQVGDVYHYAVDPNTDQGEIGTVNVCANSTTWQFIHVGENQYYIYNPATNRYLNVPEIIIGENDVAFTTEPAVWNFTNTGTTYDTNNKWWISHERTPERLLMFNNSKITNGAESNITSNKGYYLITIGECFNPIYTTNPVENEYISIQGRALVTSTEGQTVKSRNAIRLVAKNQELQSLIRISAPNITFYDEEGNAISEITVTSSSQVTPLYVGYTPTVLGEIENPTIEIQTSQKTYNVRNCISARSLPADFAIVAKVGNLWYALPSQGLNSTDALVGYPVEVDNQNDPTAVTAVPENADWSLRQVYAGQNANATKDRFKQYGANIMFENNDSPAKMLNASVSYNYLLTDAEYSNYYETNPGLYEWTPTTTDLETYTLTNAQRTDRTLNVATNTVFGVHSDNKATTEVRFLPITGRYTPAALQVVEWKENSVVIMYNDDPAQTASVSVNGAAAQNTTLSAAQRDIAVYELAATGLATNPTQRLSITIGIEKVILPIPYIISSSKNDIEVLPGTTIAARQEVAKVSDLVILKGATLTAAGASTNLYKFRNVTIYGGGKLVIPSDKGFGVNTLTLRIGGMTEDKKYDYVYPEFVLNGKYTSSSGKINLDYVTTKEQYYTFVAPFDVKTKDIKYPVDIYGNNVAANNTGSFEFQYYDGAARATGATGWKTVEEGAEGATLTAGQGYTFLGMPKKINGTRQKYGIHRIPMSIAAGDAMTHEKTDQTISVAPHSSAKNNNSGWNLIGNPYMSKIGGLTNENIQVGKLVHTTDANDNWTGGWHWDTSTAATNQRFLVIPSNDGQSYEAVQASNATLPAFKNFFVQIRNEGANALIIPVDNRVEKSLAPARYAEEQPEKDVEVAIVLEQDEAHTDQMDFLINNIYTEDFERDADFTKMMNATNLNLYGVHPYDNLSFVAIDNNTARGSVAIGYQVPQAGEYILRMSDKPYVMFDKIEALYVTDHEMSPEVTTDIMSEPYRFTVAKAETNHTRFTVSITLKANTEDDVTTILENVDVGKDQPYKFFYQDKLYILRNGIIYDAMGKQVQTINK